MAGLLVKVDRVPVPLAPWVWTKYSQYQRLLPQPLMSLMAALITGAVLAGLGETVEFATTGAMASFFTPLRYEIAPVSGCIACVRADFVAAAVCPTCEAASEIVALGCTVVAGKPPVIGMPVPVVPCVSMKYSAAVTVPVSVANEVKSG